MRILQQLCRQGFVEHSTQWQVVLTIGCVMLVGCFGSALPTGTLSGKVMYNGKPVPAGCLVTFVSDRGFASQGIVDASGNYKLMMEGEPNIPVAKYSVAVVFPGIVGPEMTAEDEKKYMAGDPATVAKFTQKQKKSPIPEKYEDNIKSGLSFEIKEGENTYDIDLK